MKDVYSEEDKERLGFEKYNQEYIQHLENKATIERRKHYCSRRNKGSDKKRCGVSICEARHHNKDSKQHFYYLKIAASKITLNFSFEIFKTQLSYEISRITSNKNTISDFTEKQLLFLYDISLNSSGKSSGR